MTIDQRRDPRFDTDVPVQLQGEAGDIAGSLRNVSLTGAAIEFDPALGRSQVQFEIGSNVDLQTEIKPARGVVVRQDSGGIAIRFEQPEEELLAEILTTVRRVIEKSGE
jgi:hypothetical protein